MRALLAAAAALALMTGAAAAQGGPLERLRAADANGDGAITKTEARAAREAIFRRLDTNGDGFVTDAERDAARDAMGKGGGGRGGLGGGGGGGGGDTNGDGKVSRAEFLDAPYMAFERLDSNRNDILEASELEAARSLMGQRKKGAS